MQNYSGIGGYKGGTSSIKDGNETQRSTYNLKDGGLGQSTYGEKSFVSQSVNLGSGGVTQGAVSGFGGGALESSLIKNMLSTPSSKKSEDRSQKTMSPDDQRRGE